MLTLSLNEMAALSLVLTNTSVKELLDSAIVGLFEKDTTLAQDKANIIAQAINSFLK